MEVPPFSHSHSHRHQSLPVTMTIASQWENTLADGAKQMCPISFVSAYANGDTSWHLSSNCHSLGRFGDGRLRFSPHEASVIICRDGKCFVFCLW